MTRSDEYRAFTTRQRDWLFGVNPWGVSMFTGLGAPDAFALFQIEQAVYHDDWQDYSTNEPTMDGTASAILLMALQR